MFHESYGSPFFQSNMNLGNKKFSLIETKSEALVKNLRIKSWFEIIFFAVSLIPQPVWGKLKTITWGISEISFTSGFNGDGWNAPNTEPYLDDCLERAS